MRRGLLLVSLVVGVLGAAAVGVWRCAKHQQPDAPVLDTLKRNLTQHTFEAFYAYGQTHGASAAFLERHLSDSGMPRDHFRFIAHLDTSLLPTMLKGMRVGTAAQRERWVAGQAKWLDTYWQDMPATERARLQKALCSAEGQRLVRGAATFYLNELTTLEKQEAAPLITQLTRILEEINQD